jgi:hypothetical protein
MAICTWGPICIPMEINTQEHSIQATNFMEKEGSSSRVGSIMVGNGRMGITMEEDISTIRNISRRSVNGVTELW